MTDTYFAREKHPMVVCKDGAELSVQVGENLYCTPRDNKGPYTHVEVGFGYGNNERINPPATWEQYADGDGLDSNVFAYVPYELVQEYIDSHGGIDIAQTYCRAIGHEAKFRY